MFEDTYEPKNKVTIKIYGQEYTISGDLSREDILRDADYVNGKMMELGNGANIPASKVAILAALNIADEYYNEKSTYSEYEAENSKIKTELAQYVSMWEDVKSSFAKCQEDLRLANSQKDDLLKQNSEKDEQLSSIYTELSEIKRHNEVLRTRVEELTTELEQSKSAPDESERKIKELEGKCRDIESSFFDIQMENIRLKNENDNLKRQR